MKSPANAPQPIGKAKKVATFTLLPAQLIRQKGAQFDFALDEAGCIAAANQLKIAKVSKLRFCGEITPKGTRDWRLTASLGASIVQDCVITLAPVKTRVSEDVTRHFISDLPRQDHSKDALIEIDGKVETDPTPEVFDLVQIALEALSLAMPDYPRADSASFEPIVLGEANQDPNDATDADVSTDESEKPFAKLAKLKHKLQNNPKTAK